MDHHSSLRQWALILLNVMPIPISVTYRGEPRGSPGRGTPGKIEFSAPRSPGKILKNPRGKSNNKLAKIDSFYQKNVIFWVILFSVDNKEWK